MTLSLFHHLRGVAEPWETAFPKIKRFGDLKLLDDVPEILRRCARHALHIHARVGYEEGPQVPDPRAPEYQRHLEAHERWWRMIWESQKERGARESTLTPEFGPPDYMHTLPHTYAPVSDLWEICDWQAERQRDQFSQLR